jgi:hypothetical protein
MRETRALTFQMMPNNQSSASGENFGKNLLLNWLSQQKANSCGI